MKVRKKPVVIDAHLWDGNLSRLCEWIETFGDTDPAGIIVGPVSDHGHVGIRTMDSIGYVKPGDWVMRGALGEFYPCDATVFPQTYDILPAGEQVQRRSESTMTPARYTPDARD